MSNRLLVSAAVLMASLAGTTAYATHPNVDAYDGMNRATQRQDNTTGRDRVGKPARGVENHGKTREEVKRELREWRANPTSPDGYKDLGGEAGAVFVQPPRP